MAAYLEQIADILVMPDKLYSLRRILLIYSVPRVQDGGRVPRRL